MPKKQDMHLTSVSGILLYLINLAVRLAPADARDWLTDMKAELMFVPARERGRWVAAALGLALRLRVRSLFLRRRHLKLSLASLLVVLVAGVLWLPSLLTPQQPVTELNAQTELGEAVPAPMAASPPVVAAPASAPESQVQRLPATDAELSAEETSEESFVASIPDIDSSVDDSQLRAELDAGILSVLQVADTTLSVEVIADTILTAYEGKGRDPERLIFSRPVLLGELLEFDLPLTLHVAEGAAVTLRTSSGPLQVDEVAELLLVLETE